MSGKTVKISAGSRGATAVVPRTHIRIAILVLALVFLWRPGPCEAAESLRADANRVMFPLVTDVALDDGRIELHPSRGTCAIRVEIEPPDDAVGWTLYVRGDGPAFSPLGEGKPSTDMLWKLDHEAPSAYRPVEAVDAVVDGRLGNRGATVLIDLSVDVEWCTSPGRYALGLVFKVAYERSR